MNIASKALSLTVVGAFIGVGLSAQSGSAETEIVHGSATAPQIGESDRVLCEIDAEGSQVLSDLDVSLNQPISSTQ